MTSALTTAREQMAEILSTATGVQTHRSMPARINPPALIVLPGSPYMTPAATFGSYQLGLDVYLVTDSKVSETGTDALDSLVDDAVVALVTSGIGVSEVSEPYALTAGNATYLASTISTSQAISL